MISSIKIMGRDIGIKLMSSKEMKEAAANGEVKVEHDAELQAWFSPFHQTIFISKELSPAVFKRTLIHEMTHAMFSVAGLTHLFTTKQEEAVCDLSENWLELINSKELYQLVGDTKNVRKE